MLKYGAAPQPVQMSRRKIKKRPIRKGEPERPGMKIRANFGMHANEATAKPIWRHIKEFSPRVLVMESALTVEGERKGHNRMINRAVREARAEPMKRASWVGSVKKRFEAEQLRALIAAEGLLGHYLEEYSPGQLQEFERIKREGGDAIPLMELMFAGRIPEAMALKEKRVREMGVHWIGPRDKRIIRGFNGLGAELREEYGLKGEVRVLARFGAAHASIGKRLRGMGFGVEEMPDVQAPLISYRMLARLSENPGAKISRDECAELLFETAWSVQEGVFEGRSEESIVSDFMGKFRRVGLAGGFLALLEEAAKKADLGEWMGFLGKRIHGK